MTEAEWLACEDPYLMVEFLGDKISERKRRLLAVACCRRIWHLLQDNRAGRAVEMAELFADGLADQKALARACAQAWNVAAQPIDDDGWVRADPAFAAAALAAEKVSGNVFVNAALAAAQAALATGESQSKEDACAAEHRCQASLIREMFGNPFRPVQFNPIWLEGNDRLIRQLAQAIYEEYRFDALPSLAETLKEAGCQNEQILGHCYMRVEHVRGCWLLDEILGKK